MRKIIAVPECKIGLLGGSFNPPHIGHLHISLKALKKFKLSKIIWLVTPCSPMKARAIYDDLQVRVKSCKEIIKNHMNRIEVLDIEKNFRNFYSSNSIKEITTWHPQIKFYWIIGCDNLLNIHKWQKWQNIFKSTKVVVCERSSMSLKSHNTKVTFNFNPNHIVNSGLIELSSHRLYIYHTKKVNISSTDIRAEQALQDNINQSMIRSLTPINE
jgi:nicotinate-nucleotide adenylyltransferase